MEQESKTGTSKWLWITLIVVVILAVVFFTWHYASQKKTDEAANMVASSDTATTTSPIKSSIVTPTPVTPTPTTTTPTTTATPTATTPAPVVTPKPTPTPAALTWKTPTDSSFTIKLDDNTTKTVTYKIPEDWFFEKTYIGYPAGPLMITNQQTCIDKPYDDLPSDCQIIAISPLISEDGGSPTGQIRSFDSLESTNPVTKTSKNDLFIQTFNSPVISPAVNNLIAIIGSDSTDSSLKYQETVGLFVHEGDSNTDVANIAKQIVATMTLK
jgi:hypothetical protein